ncbi:MAG TPA: quinol:electron acceptor oxidoreductase subunit ActD [Gammaproteobacteria bacterium]|nr:quinol:electron acceptor oxidoreductase subunit ActD [Gammaproteobacteria bacterium]
MSKQKHHRLLGLFANFDEASAAIRDIRCGRVAGVSVDDITLKSPIEHPEVEEALGDRPVRVQYFTFAGGLFGLVGSWLWITAAQATFLVQPQGGKAVVTLVSNFVLNYEMMILGGVLATLIGFLVGARLPSKKGTLYSEKISLDQIGILLELDEGQREPIKNLFQQHKVLEIREEVIR